VSVSCPPCPGVLTLQLHFWCACRPNIFINYLSEGQVSRTLDDIKVRSFAYFHIFLMALLLNRANIQEQQSLSFAQLD